MSNPKVSYSYIVRLNFLNYTAELPTPTSQLSALLQLGKYICPDVYSDSCVFKRFFCIQKGIGDYKGKEKRN